MNEAISALKDKYRLTELANVHERLALFLRELEQLYGGADGDGMLRAVINAIPGYVSWFGSDLKYLGVNEKLASDFGLQPGDFIGQSIDFLGAGGPVLEFVSTFLRGQDSHCTKVIASDFGGRKPGGWFMLVAQKYNERRNAVVVGIDITDLKQAEAMVAEQREKMESAARMAALGRMAAGIAHEINNPLTVLLAQASLLLRLLEQEKSEPAKLKASAEKIEAMVQRVATIVTSCKQFSRSGKGEDSRAVSLKKLIQEAFNLCEGRLRMHRVSFSSEVAEDLMIKCRPTQISQVLVNLISNAADAVRLLAERWLVVKVEEHAEYVEVAVVDSGKGVPEAALKSIFVPFVTSKGSEGTGLGLNICRGIIEEHGGEIGYDSDCRNTRFYFRLPKIR